MPSVYDTTTAAPVVAPHPRQVHPRLVVPAIAAMSLPVVAAAAIPAVAPVLVLDIVVPGVALDIDIAVPEAVPGLGLDTAVPVVVPVVEAPGWWLLPAWRTMTAAKWTKSVVNEAKVRDLWTSIMQERHQFLFALCLLASTWSRTKPSEHSKLA